MNEATAESALAGKRAVVVGATGAIGGAVAAALAAEGVDLLLTGRDSLRLEGLTLRLRETQPGVRVEPHPADLTEPGAVDALAAHAAAALGAVDLLVLALGRFEAAAVEETTGADLDRQLAVNLRVPWEVTRALLPTLARRRGEIVFVNSSAAFAPRARLAAYAASKAALKALADALRAEVNPRDVRVLSVYPGRTASAMQQQVSDAFGQRYEPDRLLQPEDVAAAILGALRLPRSAELTDLHLRPMQP
jgi:short-subunit dehydrogenase